MNIFKKYYYLFKKRKDIINSISSDLFYDKKYLAGKHKITKLPTVDILDIAGDIDLFIENYTFLEGNSLISDISLLVCLAKDHPDCSFLEIGSWKGETISNVSKYAQHCCSITLSKEDILKAGLPEAFSDGQGMFMDKPNINIFYSDSTEFDFRKLNMKFDLIFIDGDHTHKAVLSDTINSFNLLRDDNSVIVWHDYGYSTEKENPVILSAILDGIPQDNHKYLYHVSNTLCAVYIKKSFDTYETIFPTIPAKVFDLSIKSRKIQS